MKPRCNREARIPGHMLYLGVILVFSEEKELLLRLGYIFVPHVDRESCRRPAHDGIEVVLPRLGRLLCQVAIMIICQNKLESNVGCPYFFPVYCQDLVTEDLVFWDYLLVFHSIE